MHYINLFFSPKLLGIPVAQMGLIPMEYMNWFFLKKEKKSIGYLKCKVIRFR